MIVRMVEQAILSVRGEARRTIAPDYLRVQCGLGVTADSKVDALARVRAAQQRLTGSLTDLGGAVLTMESRRSALTWSMGSVGTHEEHDFDKRTGHHGPTGRVVANGIVVITARDMALLTNLAGALASVDQLHVDQMSWHVDSDNPAWREVRADAIAAAIVKGRDYAAALGGTVTKVEHVADAGLLSPGAGHPDTRAVSLGFAVAASADASGGTTDTPSLDPVPQEINAVVEARLVAEVAPLA
jgi:uncharacterized protein YggE